MITMRTTTLAARGRPLAALLVLLVAAIACSVAAGERLSIEQHVEWTAPTGGSGVLPDGATLEIRLLGWEPPTGYPADIMIIVDASASSDVATSKALAFDLIERLRPSDRIGLISYGSQAVLESALTDHRLSVKAAVADLSHSGKSALGDAIRMARRELASTGRDDAVWTILLFSDGQFNVGQDPALEAQMAAEYGVRIDAIGVGQLIINRIRLQSFADRTGGVFYERPTESTIDQIIGSLSVEEVATDVWVEKRLPEGLRLLSTRPTALRVDTGPDGVTTVHWRISSLRVGQEISLGLTLGIDALGPWTQDQDLVTTYVDFRGVQGTRTDPGPNWPPIAQFDLTPLTPTTTDTISFSDASQDMDPEAEIVRWEWQIGAQTVSYEKNPTHRFEERGTYTVRLVVVDADGARSLPYERQVVVGNAAPVAGFVLRDVETRQEKTRPHLGVLTLLDASGSYDPDGEIVMYRWDLDGDGLVDLESSSAQSEVTFDEPGTRTITMTAIDDEGKTASTSQTVEILPSVVARRVIDTCIPEDLTIPAGEVRVSIMVGINTVVNGLSVRETVPAGWTFAAVDSDGATIRQSGQTVEWLFLERFSDDGVNVQREIKYTLIAPGGSGERVTSSGLQGVIGSSSPRVSLPIAGEDRILVSHELSVPVAISRWDTRGSVLDPCLAELIAFDQVQYAVSLWLSDGEVPHTGGKTVDLAMMQDLIAYWLTGSSVHDPLP
jgi:PKD repeat protein